MSRILAVSYGGGHAAAIAPVVKELISKGHDVTTIALTTAAQYFRSQQIKSIGFRDLVEDHDSVALVFGRELLARITQSPAVNIDETVAYLGLSYQDMVYEYGESAARERYSRLGRGGFLPVKFFNRVIKKFRSELVLATSAPRSERAAIIAAGCAGLPSVCIVDLFCVREIEWVGSTGFSSKVCVLNQGVKNFLVAYGRSQEEVIVTGNPAFDSLNSESARRRGLEIRHERGWNDSNVTILYASQVEPYSVPGTDGTGNPNLPVEIESELRRLVKIVPGFRLVVRHHPSEMRPFEPQENVWFSPTTENLDSVLHAVDIVVVTTSTVGLQAHVIGKPVVCVKLSIMDGETMYWKMGVAEGVDSISEVRDLIFKLSRSNSDSNALNKLSLSSCATQSVASVVEKLIQ